MKNKLLLLLTIILLVAVSTGCGESTKTADRVQTEQTDRLQEEANRQIGLPNITNFYEKKMAKEIYELRDDSKLITYAYMQNLDGKFIFLGQTVGFGLPYSVQYSNPEKIVEGDHEVGWDMAGIGSLMSKPQAEPNGLFMPEGLSATWLMYINPETGKREIIYSEPSIVVTQSKLPKRLVAEWSIPSNY